jgi:hypothetical protein
MARNARRLGKGNTPAPTLARAGTRCGSHPILPGAGQQKRRSIRAGAGASPHSPEPASRSIVPSASKPEEPRPKRLRRPVTIIVPTHGFAQQAISLSIKQKTFCAMAKAHSEERHSHSKRRRASEDLQEIKEVLKPYGWRLHTKGHAKGRRSKSSPKLLP